MRGSILALEILNVAKKISLGESDENDTLFMEYLKLVCDEEALEQVNLGPRDIINLVVGQINDILPSLDKLVKLLTIEPLNTEDILMIYEYAQKALKSA